MRYRLRTLMIVLALGPPVLAWAWLAYQRHIADPPIVNVHWTTALIIAEAVTSEDQSATPFDP